MGHSPLRHHEVSLKAPVLAAARAVQDNIAVLARDGARAYADALDDAGEAASHPLTRRLLAAVANVVMEA